MNTILVNSTAARSSGALSILNQFVSHIPEDDGNRYYLFVDTHYKETVQQSNVVYVHLDTISWRKRILWDEFGLKRWVRKNALSPDLIISLQNTGVNYGKNIPQLIYYHQVLLLSGKKWHFYKKEERLFFIYKRFYPFFVARSLHRNTSVVLQIPSSKTVFVRKFKIPVERVHVIPPEVQSINYDEVAIRPFTDGKRHFIYPATPLLYKNHKVLLQALHELKKSDEEVFREVKLHFTLKEDNALGLKNTAEELGVADAVSFEGVLPFKQLLAYYKSMDALLYPSFIESFGLPLLEAAGAGIAIVASDLPYVHDVIGEYEGVSYVDYADCKGWALAIAALCRQEQKRYPSFRYPAEKGGWDDFFALINKLKKKQ